MAFRFYENQKINIMPSSDDPQYKTRNRWRTFICTIVLGLLLVACFTPSPKTYTIGVVNYTSALNSTFDGFKAGMAELGYVEGEDVTYI